MCCPPAGTAAAEAGLPLARRSVPRLRTVIVAVAEPDGTRRAQT
ncbi:hypothetical protein ACFO3C_01000 [Halostagnicola sp. GCM10023398]